MILDQKKTTLAYRCPSCGGITTSIVGAFSLSGKLFRLKCDCGGSVLSLEKTSDGKIRLRVPCIVCPTPHTYTISQNVFFGEEAFIISCALSGIDICFIGPPEKLVDAINKSNAELMKLLKDNDIESIENGNDEEKMSDPQVLDIVTYVIHELNDEGKIYCNCPHGKGVYECSISDNYITVRCKKCGAFATIPADSTIKAHDFLSSDSLTLE